MNEQTAKLLEQLAQKLGTTTEYLWRVLLSQAKIEAAIDAFIILLSAAVVVFTVIFCKRNSEEIEDMEGKGLLAGALCIFSFILTVFAFFVFREMLTAVFNPEYWALEQILKRL